MKIYIAGPITGMPNLGRPAFDAAAATLEAAGVQHVHPFHNGVHLLADWDEHMRADIRLLLECTHIMLLDGWRQSNGARLEFRIAMALRMEIFSLKPAARMPITST